MVILMMNNQVKYSILILNCSVIYFELEWQRNTSLCVTQTNTISNNQFDLDEDGIEDSQKETQSLL